MMDTTLDRVRFGKNGEGGFHGIVDCLLELFEYSLARGVCWGDVDFEDLRVLVCFDFRFLYDCGHGVVSPSFLACMEVL